MATSKPSSEVFLLVDVLPVCFLSSDALQSVFVVGKRLEFSRNKKQDSRFPFFFFIQAAPKEALCRFGDKFKTRILIFIVFMRE